MFLFFCRMGKSLKTLDYDTDGIRIMDSGDDGLTPEEKKKFADDVRKGNFIAAD